MDQRGGYSLTSPSCTVALFDPQQCASTNSGLLISNLCIFYRITIIHICKTACNSGYICKRLIRMTVLPCYVTTDDQSLESSPALLGVFDDSSFI